MKLQLQNPQLPSNSRSWCLPEFKNCFKDVIGGFEMIRVFNIEYKKRRYKNLHSIGKAWRISNFYGAMVNFYPQSTLAPKQYWLRDDWGFDNCVDIFCILEKENVVKLL